MKFEIERKDFWKYNHKQVKNAYWTGYFSTNPEIKLQIMNFSDFV